MVTPIESSLAGKAFDWAKRWGTQIFQIGKRIATLEERVTALEEALKKQPAEACSYCGERTVRLTSQSGLLGDPGKQWTEDTWTCSSCGEKYIEREKFKV
jgi:uncharacterized protein with PIN domain